VWGHWTSGNQLSAAQEQLKGSAPSFKEPPSPSTPSPWTLVATSATNARGSHSRTWALYLKWVENFASELHKASCQSCCLIFPYQTCSYQYYYQLSSGAGFRSSLQSSWSPLILFLILLVKEFYGTRYQSGAFSWIDVGSGFQCLRNFLFFFFISLLDTAWATSQFSLTGNDVACSNRHKNDHHHWANGCVSSQNQLKSVIYFWGSEILNWETFFCHKSWS